MYRAILVPTLITQIVSDFSQMTDYRGFSVEYLSGNPLKRMRTDSILNNAKVSLLLLEKIFEMLLVYFMRINFRVSTYVPACIRHR